jgi:hypothetical protein
MKRAEPKVIHASLLQLDKTSYDLDNIDPAQYLLYGLVCDHSGSIYELTINKLNGPKAAP